MAGEHPERPTRRADLSVRVVEDETLVLDRAAGSIHTLNATAAFIWARCDGQHTPEQIGDALAGAFDVDAQTARQAVLTSLGRFAELGLLRD